MDFTRELGLRSAARESLGWPFVSTLALGAGVAWTLGGLAGERDDLAWAVLASLILWQPAAEELLFRGFLQGALRRRAFGTRRIAGLTNANWLTSAAFAGVHLVHQPVTWALGTFFPSLIFGLYRDRSGSLWPPFLLHACFNGAFFLARAAVTGTAG